ncbi:STAS domain-containing protein [Catellatospora sp. KI3]|uniref:STAS domain-containing protein n=1 Tax=Catellatospora sp. KI3 TaxID=3041620 RepID=UPI0024826146|nr:STAS domain-containing protein [Catellatospora sp. KI3]MDI1464128.1 STAS domain-containing protein [Catellatospora sp. KI3]
MTDDIALRLTGTPGVLRLALAGALLEANAHRLPKVVIAVLRRHRITAIELDLAAVSRLDGVGAAAVRLCAREAARRAIAFTISACSAPARHSLARHGAASLLPPPVVPRHTWLHRPHTGTVCRPRRPLNPAGGPR